MTENPSFEINKALFSRLSVYTLNVLNVQELEQILQRAFKHESLTLLDETLRMQIISANNGDTCRLINIVEQISLSELTSLNSESINQLLQDKISTFDKGGDIFYQQLSTFLNQYVVRLLMGFCIGWQECWFLDAMQKRLLDVYWQLPQKTLAMLIHVC